MSVKKLVVAAAALFLAATVGTGALGARSESPSQAQAPASSDRLTADVLKGLAFRSIGPVIQTGRVAETAQAAPATVTPAPAKATP